MTSSTSAGSSVKFLPQGALIQEFVVNGHNIVLGFPSAGPYTYLNAPFFGETIGRYANRIKDGLIKNLNGREYQLAQNDGKNSIHGGSIGWGKRIFSGPQLLNRNGKETVQFTYISPDQEEGYPGTVELRVWYSTSEQVEDGRNKMVLDLEYEAELTGDECNETAINITNHRFVTTSTMNRNLMLIKRAATSISVVAPQSKARKSRLEQTIIYQLTVKTFPWAILRSIQAFGLTSLSFWARKNLTSTTALSWTLTHQKFRWILGSVRFRSL